MFKTKISSVFLFTVLAVTATTVRAEDKDTSPDQKVAHDSSRMEIAGAGGAYQEFNKGNKTGAFVLQYNAVGINNGGKSPEITTAGRTMYSTSGASLDVSPEGIGARLDARVGNNLWKRKDDAPVAPLIGIEPLSLSMGTSVSFKPGTEIKKDILGIDREVPAKGLHRINGREPFFEWTPMAAIGAQFFTDSCKAMVAVRGGAAIGTLGDGGVRPAYGAGASAVCNNKLIFNADFTRIVTENSNVDMANLMAGVKIPGQDFAIGAVFEGRDTKDTAKSPSVYSFPTASGDRPDVAAKLFIGGAF